MFFTYNSPFMQQSNCTKAYKVILKGMLQKFTNGLHMLHVVYEYRACKFHRF